MAAAAMPHRGLVERRTFGIGLGSALLVGPLLAGRAKAASDEDLARLIADGRLDDALTAMDGAMAQRQASASLRLMAGALRLAHGDYAGARGLFEAGDQTGGYLMGGPLDVDVLRTHIIGGDWRYLASVRAGEPDSGGLSAPFSRIVSGTLDVGAYAAQQGVMERIFYDGLVLSIASSPGRTRFLDSAASRARSQHFL